MLEWFTSNPWHFALMDLIFSILVFFLVVLLSGIMGFVLSGSMELGKILVKVSWILMCVLLGAYFSNWAFNLEFFFLSGWIGSAAWTGAWVILRQEDDKE